MARIVILDDAEMMRTALSVALSQAGHCVAEAADAASALDQLRTWQPDLLLTDIVMPKKDGIETIREVRKEFPRLPIIAMSGATFSQVYLQVAGHMGAVRILTKPFLITELDKLIAELLRGSQAESVTAP